MDEICKNLLVYIIWQGPWYENPLANEELFVSLFIIERKKKRNKRIKFKFLLQSLGSNSPCNMLINWLIYFLNAASK